MVVRPSVEYTNKRCGPRLTEDTLQKGKGDKLFNFLYIGFFRKLKQ